MIVRAYKKADLDAMIQIWNEVVEEGIACYLWRGEGWRNKILAVDGGE